MIPLINVDDLVIAGKPRASGDDPAAQAAFNVVMK